MWPKEVIYIFNDRISGLRMADIYHRRNSRTVEMTNDLFAMYMHRFGLITHRIASRDTGSHIIFFTNERRRESESAGLPRSEIQRGGEIKPPVG